jgi:phosphoribosylanthranilate isomerase
MIFTAQSPRQVEVGAAAEIGTAMRRRVEVTGVFLNAPLDEVVELADLCSLTMIQLHGDEGPSYCAELGHRTGLKVIKAARVRDRASVQALRAFRVGVDYHLLDAYAEDAHGGTGKTFSWELAKSRGAGPPLILSGGITPENVGEAIASVRPFGVDSASGTEASPGVKDPAKVTALMRAAEQASLAVA